MNAESGWNISIGNNSVSVGVIDSGIADHPDLDENIVEGWDFVNNDNQANDDVTGHGTHVAGIIGATGANVDGVAGVSWNVQLIPLQVIDTNGLWPLTAVTGAITWAINYNIDILNYSGGGYNDNEQRRTAIYNYSGLFVCGSGNGGDDHIGDDNDSTFFYPSDYSSFSNRIISVGAINNTGNIYIESNYGENTVSLFAPGAGILSTVPTSVNSTGYETWNGTSYAAPFVTGTAALMLALIESKPHDMTPNLCANQINDY